MKIKLLLLAFMLFFGFTSENERTITGIIKAADDNSPLPGVLIQIKGTNDAAQTDANGKYSIKVTKSNNVLVFSFLGCITKEVPVPLKKNVLDVMLETDAKKLEEVIVTGYQSEQIKVRGLRFQVSKLMEKKYQSEQIKVRGKALSVNMDFAASPALYGSTGGRIEQAEEYSTIEENIFHETNEMPVTTFSIDVDRASYSNLRRIINTGYLPPKDAVRIEEMINYFDYEYLQPEGKDPVRFQTEISDSPWNKGLKLLHIGLQARKIATENLPASNLVFLIDVSGSMSNYNKLPLLKEGFKLLVDQLRPKDYVSIVVYAGAAGVC
ncbi:VWA domain-containing protein [Emticicia sp. 17c]|uniref:VWA domain-containing protein n=1 Tax=Emticicia sp. 17c TaxID=3127704 RepID=UPI00301D7B99